MTKSSVPALKYWPTRVGPDLSKSDGWSSTCDEPLQRLYETTMMSIITWRSLVLQATNNQMKEWCQAVIPNRALGKFALYRCDHTIAQICKSFVHIAILLPDLCAPFPCREVKP